MTAFQQRHAVVSGGGTGLGAAVATALMEAGHRVTVLGRTEALLRTVVGDRANGLAITADVTDRAAVDQAVAQAVKAFGAVEITVANAGASESAPFEGVDNAHWDRMLAVNLTGVFHLFQATLSPMRETGWGRLIAVSSTAGLKGYPYVSPYCAAKHGVIGLVRALAIETARDGVTVNAICPGFAETPMLDRAIDNITGFSPRTKHEAQAVLQRHNPQGRFVKPQEVAAAALYLCSDGADCVTGQALSLSGGEVM